MLGDDFSGLLNEVAPFIEPRVDIFASDAHYIISVDLAGAGKEDFSVKLRRNTLIVEGTIQNLFAQKSVKMIYGERFYGSFRKEMLIPESCLLDYLSASFESGILWITFPFLKGNNTSGDS
ncbi:Hsp20/alpha crystallin family protein [Peribacillus kribbensis]|uniref:Hsp20/alpha crystallin family protein n=1 Tax=Peribacillus kribbensis TaxID=356658 RepID=UPI00138AD179|nr:Hsp20/alpha crystallin family protein [Peribacillus kribbensis]